MPGDRLKKGQLQTLEPIFVVILLVLLLGGALFFFFRYAKTQASQDTSIANEQEAISLLKKVTTLPELSCPTSITGDTYCIDMYKADAFSGMMNNDSKRAFYFPLFGTASITLEIVSSSPHDPIVLYNTLPKDPATLDNLTIFASTTYFLVFDPVLYEKDFAILTVRRASR